MKRLLVYILALFPVLTFAQRQKGDIKECAPMKNGKICYRDTVHVKNMDQEQIFEVLHKWAIKNYGKDYFVSSLNSNKTKGIINVSSKIELLLNETEKTTVKYKMNIFCHDNSYAVEISDIVYLYDPMDKKKFKTYPAEDVIINNGEGNIVSLIKDPKLFCSATRFYTDNLFTEILNTINKAE